MCEELMKIEYAKLRTFDTLLFKRTVEDMTKMFCESALIQKEQSLLSEIQKSMESKRLEKLAKDEETDEEFKKELAEAGIVEVERDDSQLNTKSK